MRKVIQDKSNKPLSESKKNELRKITLYVIHDAIFKKIDRASRLRFVSSVFFIFVGIDFVGCQPSFFFTGN